METLAAPGSPAVTRRKRRFMWVPGSHDHSLQSTGCQWQQQLVQMSGHVIETQTRGQRQHNGSWCPPFRGHVHTESSSLFTSCLCVLCRSVFTSVLQQLLPSGGRLWWLTCSPVCECYAGPLKVLAANWCFRVHRCPGSVRRAQGSHMTHWNPAPKDRVCFIPKPNLNQGKHLLWPQTTHSAHIKGYIS